MAITGLMQGPDGHTWEVADGTLFVLDLATRQVISRLPLYEMQGRPSHIWRNAFLLVHPSGQVYGNANDKLFRIALIWPASTGSSERPGRYLLRRYLCRP
jgi:hypothetical protein